MIQKYIFSLLIVLVLFSCKEKMVEIPPFVPPESDRVVLLEELTGVSCVNCPEGAAAVEDLLQLYEGQLVAIAIHGGALSEPLADSKYDFRYPDAMGLEDHLKPFYGKPAAAINRVGTPDEQAFLIPDTWSGYITEELKRPHVLNLDLATEYEAESRKLTVNTGAIALDDITEELKISVCITESHIIDAQLSGGGILTEFEFNHVLKEMLTEVSGDALASSMEKNEIINKEYTFTLPTTDDLWIPENCHVVAFVSRITADGEEVLQAAEAHVTE